MATCCCAPPAKNTITGKGLALLLKKRFVDLDQQIEAFYQKQHTVARTCREIYKVHGESFFRNLEHDVLRIQKAHSSIILSTGGGTPLNPKNSDIIAKLGLVIYLKPCPSVIFERMKQKGFPAYLGVKPGLDHVKTAYEDRDIVYRKIADHTIDNSQLSVAGTVETICSTISDP